MRGESPWQTTRARVLRSTETAAEEKLWSHLRNRQLGGFKFVRQFPIGKYFADFACRELKLVVEVDGGTHGETHEVSADRFRSAAIEQSGFVIFRIDNTDVLENIDGVLDQLLAELECRRP